MQSTNNIAQDGDRILSAKQASEFIGLSTSTLAKLRMGSEGPRFVRLSATKVGYRLSILKMWVHEREVSSTKDD